MSFRLNQRPTKIEIEVRPESSISTTWRVYPIPVRPGEKVAPLEKGGYVLGGSKLQAIQDALALVESHGFVLKNAPDDLPPIDGVTIL